jgi:hypothetical protein
MAKLYIVKNEETGVTKGIDLTQTVDLVYFDAIQETISQNPDDFDNDEVKALMGGWDIGYYTDLQSMVHQMFEVTKIGRYTVTPVI